MGLDRFLYTSGDTGREGMWLDRFLYTSGDTGREGMGLDRFLYTSGNGTDSNAAVTPTCNHAGAPSNTWNILWKMLYI